MHTLALAAVTLLSANPAAAKSDPVYLAVCREVPEAVFPNGAGMRIELLGVIEGASLMAVDLGTVRAPEPIASRIASLDWHFLDPEGVAGRTGRFADARLTHVWNESNAVADSARTGGEESILVLGACEVPGTIYATLPASLAEQANVGARDEHRVREEIESLGASRDVEVERVGDAVVGRGRITARREVIDAAIAARPYDRDIIPDSFGSPVSVLTVVHPDAPEPVRIGAHEASHKVDVLHVALVRIGGHDLAIVVSEYDAYEGGNGTEARVVFLRTGAWFVKTLAAFGC